ncbi:MAG TPA: IS21 family transposase [Gemmataceae bacterium]|nr:IS21 family transposase [Gemmataceae bacterium]
MLTVFQYGDIRRAHRDGMSIREIARTFHHSRKKIRQILAEAEPRLGAFHGVIDAILADDETAPPKQRHTASQVFRRLRDEHGYRGGYDQVRRYVGQHRRDRRETLIPLAHDPGQRLEADFGHIYVDFPDGRKQVPVLVVVWSYSNYPFVMAMPSERTEAILAGMVEAFHFFGCVSHEVWWDNPRTVASQIYSGRERRVNERYAALASHYAYDPLFCMPARGNEKPYAETRVRVMQRQWATPVPRVANLDELNAMFRARCLDEAKRTVAGYSESIGQHGDGPRCESTPHPHGTDPFEHSSAAHRAGAGQRPSVYSGGRTAARPGAGTRAGTGPGEPADPGDSNGCRRRHACPSPVTPPRCPRC